MSEYTTEVRSVTSAGGCKKQLTSPGCKLFNKRKSPFNKHGVFTLFPNILILLVNTRLKPTESKQSWSSCYGVIWGQATLHPCTHMNDNWDETISLCATKYGIKNSTSNLTKSLGILLSLFPQTHNWWIDMGWPESMGPDFTTWIILVTRINVIYFIR